MQRKSIFASTSFRLALVSAAVLLAAFAVAGAGAWLVIRAAAERASRERIEVEMDALEAAAQLNGLAGLAAEIGARERSPWALQYRLTDANGAALAGDLVVVAAPGWSKHYLPNDGAARSPDFIVLSRVMPDGATLVIAEDLERSEGVRYAILRTLFWVGLGAALLSLVVGYLATRGTLLRMDSIFATMARVDAGDFAARVDERGGDSDIDLLGQRINETLARVGDLVGNLRRVSTDIAHDLRTPITHVRQDIEAIQAADTLEGAKTAARAAQGKIERLTRAFEAMLRLAEIEAGTARARFAPTELSGVVERIADAYGPDIESAGRVFVVETAPGVSIVGDPDLLGLAVSNLLDNAIKHAAGGKRVALRLSADEARVRLEVEDDGPGVSAADRARVLDPFVRLDESRSSAGVGLGLSIVNAIAKLHDGALILEDAAPGLRVAIEWRR